MGMKRKHAILAALLLVGGGGTLAYTQLNKPSAAPKYVLAQAAKGTLVVSASGSGQVSGQNQVDVLPTVSGNITTVLVKTGDAVKTGTPLFQIDGKTALRDVRDARQSVHDAQLSLQSAQLAYQKFVAPAKALDVEKAQDAVKQAEADLATQKENAKLTSSGMPQVERTAYDKAATQLKSLSETLNESLYDADNVLGVDNVSANDSFESLLSVLDSSRLQLADASYAAAKTDILALKQLTDNLPASGGDPAAIDSAMTAADAALHATEPLLQQTYEALLATLTSSSFSQSQLDSLRSKIQGDHSNVVAQMSTTNDLRNAIDQAKTSYDQASRDLVASQEKLDEAKQALADLNTGPDPLDIAVQKNDIAQRESSLQSAENHLADALDTLNDYVVRAPFDGVIVSVAGKLAQPASPSAKLATLLTKAKMVTIPLNEVDIANVKVGQKATITFDAVQDLSIAGQVTEVDQLGSVSQGVVTYNVQVAFLTDDDRVKPGMSASVTIATDVRTDVLTVPNGAVKNGAVQILPDVKNPGAEAQITGVTSAAGPQPVQVQTGAANDQSTEIVSGLNEGDWVVLRTITPGTTASTASAGGNRNAGFIGGGGGLGGGTFRIQTR
jgi:HlyD family secretion protein